jgi:iron complex transport system permease protein
MMNNMTDTKRHGKSILFLLTACLAVVIVSNAAVGSADISAMMVAKITYMGILEGTQNTLSHFVPSIGQSPVWDYLSLTKTWPPKYEVIVLQSRIPRVVLAGLVGAALSTAGCAMQGLLKNPMADPYIIGMSSGASLGASLAMLLGLYVQTTAFVFSILTIFLVYNISRVGRSVPIDTLLLAGIAVGSFLSAFTSFLVYINQSRDHVIFWMMGSFANASWEKVGTSSVMIIAGIILLYRHAWNLNVMLLGEEQAQYLGVNIEWVKRYILLLASLITGAAVAVSGIIGFVGLIIPHITRIIVGPDHRILFPTSTIAGSIFLIMCDTISRIVIPPENLPVGIITAMFGAPFFIYLLRKRRKTIYA